MEKLVFADPFRKPTPARFERAEDEDDYYRSREPKRRGNRFSVITLVGFVGFLVLTLNWLPR